MLAFYRDLDSDGFGLLSSTIQACSAPAGYVTNNTDCNDSNAAINPNAAEIVCNGIDENCNSVTDEGILPIFFEDDDNDGFGNKLIFTHACIAPPGFVTDSTDCNDSNSSIKPGTSEICNGVDDNCNVTIDEGVLITYYMDSDVDGFGTVTSTTEACSVPPGFVSDSTDCNDGNASIHPGVSEICNVLDDNCNVLIDEGVQITYYADADNDGFGDDLSTIQACTPPFGFISDNTDCDDGNVNIHPGAPETCNNLDDDCDGQTDENVKTVFYKDDDSDGFGNAGITALACSVPAGFVSNNTDCNDSDAGIKPTASETCNAVDDNCNGNIDEGVKLTFFRDADGDGYGNPAITKDTCTAPAGFASDNTDCDDGHASAHPGAIELCNGIDDNCNGTIDEGAKTFFYRDADNDGFGNVNATFLACTAPAGYISDSTDCNDNNAAVHPGVIEISNGIDDNCNGITDEGFPATTVSIHLKIFIEGYYLGNGLMQAAIDPINQASICDTLSVELHDAVYPFSLAFADKKTINIDGAGDFNFPISSMGQSYYLVVRHRNAIETWTANPITIGTITSYDFTTSKSKVFGSNMVMTNDSMGWAIYSGDISDAVLGVGYQDGVIESQDNSDMENAVALTLSGYVVEDITGDGIVESSDYSIMENNVYYVIFSMRP